MNTYGYVGGNPSRFVDPFGLREIIVIPEYLPAYEALLESQKARELIDMIHDLPGFDNNPLVIGKSDNCDASNSGDFIDIHPNFNPKLLTTLGTRVPSLTVLIAHELAHTVEPASTNINLNDQNFEQLSNYWELTNIVNKWENPIRVELGLPERLAYQPVVEADCTCN